MRRLVTAALAAALLTTGLAAAPSGADAPGTTTPLAMTPPMGWNSWNAVGCGVNEKLITDTIDTFVTEGLQDAGYEYVNIDDCWSLKQRDAQGKLVADPEKFPMA